MLSEVSKVGAAALVCLAACCLCLAQETAESLPSLPESAKAEPVLSGGLAFVPIWDGGKPTLDSIAAPVLLVPLGSNLLFESRAEFEGEFHRRNGDTGDFTGPVDKSLDYAELDYIANQYVTLTVGRFVTPFNIFNERLYPAWIRDTQTDPLIYSLETGSDDGAMVRGGVPLAKTAALNYAAYYSVLSTNAVLQSERHAGMRAGIFLPRHRLEIGGSVQHQLQKLRVTRYGSYLEWQPLRASFDLRAESAYSRDEGSGFWIEGAYRFRNTPLSFVRHTQVVGRTQLFHTGNVPQFNEDLPRIDTKRTEFGLNYYLSDGWKALASYGRTFTAAGNSNIWTVGMTYRFVFPLGLTQ